MDSPRLPQNWLERHPSDPNGWRHVVPGVSLEVATMTETVEYVHPLRPVEVRSVPVELLVHVTEEGEPDLWLEVDGCYLSGRLDWADGYTLESTKRSRLAWLSEAV